MYRLGFTFYDVPLQVATTCSSCVALQDPYCGWDLVSSKCVSQNNFNSNYASEFLQNITVGKHRQCGDSESSVIIEEFKVKFNIILCWQIKLFGWKIKLLCVRISVEGVRRYCRQVPLLCLPQPKLERYHQESILASS